MQDHDTADGEAADGSERGHEHKVGAEMADVSEDRGNRADQSQYVEPEWRANLSAQVPAQTKLQQERGESDGGDNDQSQRAGESPMAGVDHHESESEKKKSGGDDGRARALRR